MNKVWVVGLTGMFGSGKTTVSALFRAMGAMTINADELAHAALAKGSEEYDAVVKHFGEEILDDEGQVDRGRLGARVFNDFEKRKQLENIIHPVVFDGIRERLRTCEQDVAVLDVPLLYETDLNLLCDATVVVETQPEILFARMEQRGFSQEEVLRRQAVQMPLSEKKVRATYVICNDNSIEETRQQVEAALKKMGFPTKGE